MVFYLRSCEVRTEVRFKSLTVGQGDISLQQIILMGPCASHSQDGKRNQLPLVYQVPGSKQKVFTSGLNELQFQLSKVSIVPSPSPDSDLSFSISGIAEIPMQRANKSSQRLEDEQLKPADKTFEIKWQQVNKLELCLSDAQLVQTYLSVHLTQDNKVAVEVVRISLYLIVNGPYHHNIEVPLGKHPRRVIFDAKISHIFEINTRVQQLDLNLNHGFLNSFKLCHFTVKAIRQEEVIADSAQSYSIDPQILCKLQQNTENYFQQQRPNISKLKTIKKTFPQEGQKLTPLSWSNLAQKNSEKKMPEVTFDSSTLQIASYSIQIGIWSENDRRSQYVCQANVPLWKLLDREYIKEKKNREDTQGNIVSLQDRILTIAERVYCHQDVIGTCELQLHILNQKLIEQSKYSSRTEEGVVNLRPSTFTKTINSNSKTIHQIWKLSNQIDKTVKEEAFKSSIEEVQAKIQLILRQIYEILKTTLNQVLYSDANKCEALLNNQQIFISLMTKLSPFTEDAQNSSLSQISWAIIIGFLKRRQFVLQNLSLKGIYETPQSQHIFNKKKDVGLKYQEVLYKLITNALRCYGLYSSNNNMLSHFLSFCYFRVPTFRDYFLEVMDFQNNYAQMESKLIVFQRQIEPKTSFGSSFAQIKGDWKSNFYDQLQQIGKSKDLGRQLLCSFRSKKFFMQLSYKDQTLYNFFSLLFRCLSNDSSQKADKWKYIQGYSKIVAIILTVLKEKEVTKYSPSLIKLSIDLLENEHLLSPMLPLICDQTNVHDVQKVQIALDLMEQYLQAATKKKERQIPTSFNSNYLLKVVRAILEGENCYAINRFLVIIYHFFDQFGTGFKLQISMYLTGKIFFKLFYHWSSEVRYTFYILLLVKVQHISHPRKAQINSHITKILSIVKIFYIIYDKNHTKTHIATQQALYKKMKMKVQQKFKKNKPCKSSSNNKKEYSLENIYKMLDQDIVICPQFFSQQLIKNKSGVDHTPAKNRFIENEQFDLEIPGKSERSFSDKIPPQQILKKSPSFCEMEGEGKKQDFSRKKRRPSVFVQSIVVSPNSKNQLIPKISNELQELSELQEGEIKNIGISTAQFNEVSQQISKYAQTHSGALPTSDYIDIKKNVSAA